VVFCQQLANLCVLDMYADTSAACIAHKAIITQRGSNVITNVNNWVKGQPWLYFAGQAGTVCTTYVYKRRVTLNQLVMRYAMASFFMNGTFAG
jgi:hypothetical protein